MEFIDKISPEIKCGDHILKLDLGEPSEYAKEKAVQELRETTENIENSLKELKLLLEDEKDLNVPKSNDKWLMRFLRRCKYYPESTRDLIKRFYNLRLKNYDVTEKLTPSQLKHVFEANLVSILPLRDQLGRRLVVTLAGNTWNHKLIKADDVFCAGTLCFDAVQVEPETQINGAILIIDMKGLSFSQTFQLSPFFVKRLLDYIQENVPLRIQGLHIVNQPKIFQPIFTAAKQFFIKKYANRIMMHGSNYDALHQFISPEYLPECYNGKLKINLTYGPETYELLSHYEKYFETVQKYGYNKK